MLSELCLSAAGSQCVENMSFMCEGNEIMLQIERTEEFRKILSFEKEFPLERIPDIQPLLKKIRMEGAYPEPDELFSLKIILETGRSISKFFKGKNSENYPVLSELGQMVKVYPFILGMLEKIIHKKGGIKDNASSQLLHIRKEKTSRESEISGRIQSILKNVKSEGLTDKDASVAVRNGRLVIPVGSSNKRKIKGYIHDESATGKTTYIEPSEVVELNNEIRELELAEKREIIRILKDFADAVRPYNEELCELLDILGEFDFIRAKALFASRIDGVKPVFKPEPLVNWKDAVHPLLYLTFKKEEKEVVPLNITLDSEQRILVISGPNAGGKSVCLQTVGLLQYMFQCGMLVPASENSEFGLFEQLFLDIGDEQSIENDLSTYSSRLINMKYFLKNSNDRTLILIDEFGSGTEPIVGGAIAETILQQLNRIKVYGVLTTHYTNLKHFASSEKGIVNGAMLFDTGAMQPLFRLETGKPGSSFAFEIARKIGLPEEILQSAADRVGEDHVRFDRHLKDIIRDKYYWERKRRNIRKAEKKLMNDLERYYSELKESEKERKKIIEKAKAEAREILSSVNTRIENTIKEIREAQAEKKTTKAARKKVEKLKENLQTDESGDKNLRDKLEKVENRIKNLKGDESKIEGEEAEGCDQQIKKGDMVKLSGQDLSGEVMDIDRGSILVAFGNMITTVNRNRLEKLGAGNKNEGQEKISSAYSRTLNIKERRINFSHEIDVRGMRPEEALKKADDFINEAIMLDIKEVRILHGKGGGVLRQVIRNYLRGMDLIKKYGDEIVECGGAGVTVVELGEEKS